MGKNALLPNARFDLVVLAASAGGLPTMLRLIKSIPPTFPAAIIFIQHLAHDQHSWLSEITAQKTDLIVRQVEAEDVLQGGSLYIAPPDRHLTLTENGVLRLADTPAVRFVRPSINTLLESVAEMLGERVLVVILSGMGSDGAEGIRAVKAAGGVVIAESPGSSLFPSMPQAAVDTGVVDFILDVEKIGPKILQLVNREEPV